MATFRVKRVEVPLFGVVELKSNQQPWLSSFAVNAAPVDVDLDATVFDFVADEMAIDAEDVVSSASRYASGGFRMKARGLGGAQLGDFGEVLAYVIHRATPNRKIVRVMMWHPSPGGPKSGRFPQPDFIVRDVKDQFALEVKTTESLDFQYLLGAKRWKWLQPCSRVHDRRIEALEQLGYVNGTLTPQKHRLKIIDGKVVPFPVSAGMANVVLVRDGRTQSLTQLKKYKTPPKCRNAVPARDCWNCIGGAEALLVSMRNAPRRLSLGGQGHDDGGEWLRLYERWTTAVRTQQPDAATSATRAISAALVAWTSEFDSGIQRSLRGFWGSYIRGVARERGIEAQPQDLPDLYQSDEEPRVPDQSAPRDRRVVQRVAMESLRAQLRDTVGDIPVGAYAVDIPSSVASGTESLSLRKDDDYVTFTLLSAAWWTRSEVTSNDDAAKIAVRLIWLVMITTEQPPLPPNTIGPFAARRVELRVGDNTVLLGWVPAVEHQDIGTWLSFVRPWILHAPFDPPLWCSVAIGDPRVRLRVFPDGRAGLRISRTLRPFLK